MNARFRSERGAATVEMALVIPLIIVIVGIMLFGGLYALYANTIDHAASDAARFASIREGPTNSAPYPSDDDVLSEVNNELLPGFVPDASVVVDSAAAAEGERVTVTVTVSNLPVLDVAASFLSAFGVDAFNDITRTASARRQ